MSNKITQQEIEMAKLEKSGFKFSNWIATNPDAENQDDGAQTALMVKRSRHGSEYREVSPDGSVQPSDV